MNDASCTTHELTPSGKMKKSELAHMCEQIVSALSEIPNDLIQKVFKNCCTSKALGRDDDNILWLSSTEDIFNYEADDDISSIDDNK